METLIKIIKKRHLVGNLLPLLEAGHMECRLLAECQYQLHNRTVLRLLLGICCQQGFSPTKMGYRRLCCALAEGWKMCIRLFQTATLGLAEHMGKMLPQPRRRIQAQEAEALHGIHLTVAVVLDLPQELLEVYLFIALWEVRHENS